MSLIQCPWLLSDKEALEGLEKAFSKDSICRAQFISGKVASIGAYSHSMGYQFVREDIAQYLAERDGHPASPEHIFLADGASEGIRRILQALVIDERSGVMLPLPQYPLYSATITILGGAIVPYYLDEEAGWDLSVPKVYVKIHTTLKCRSMS